VFLKISHVEMTRGSKGSAEDLKLQRVNRGIL
jgi:hypothetical protein